MDEQKKTDKGMVTCPQCAGTGETLPQFETVDELMKFIAKQPYEWSAGWYYNAAGDQVECYWENVPTVADLSLSNVGIILHRARHEDDDQSKLAQNRVVGVTIMGLVGRIALEAKQQATVRPHPSKPLQCPICQHEAVDRNGRALIYSRDPIECDNCGHTFGGDESKEP